MVPPQEAPVPRVAAQRMIGKPVQRREDARLITGRGRYVDDVALPGMLHAAFVRSQSARGTITHLDVSAARQHPGVVAVLTAAEVNSPTHQFWVTMMGPDAGYPPGRVLADGDVRYVGEPIAIVVAESRYVAEDAIELVDVDVDPLPPVLDMFTAIENADVLVHPELGTNVAGDMPADVPGLDERLAAAPHTFTETFHQHRYVQVPMETRGIVATWDRMLEHLEITVSGQSAHETRLFYSRMLGIPEDAIHVVMGDVGGSFGQKMFTQREEHAVVIAARAIGDRPVKWIEDRAENLISGGHARQEAMRVTVAVDDDGVLLGGRAWHLEDVGAYPYPGNGAAGASSLALFPGPYRWGGPGSVAYHAQAAFTNTCGRTAYRGPWMMETTGREQMMDVVAQKLGIDPLEIRRRNIVSRDEMPFTSPMQLQFETISPAETLEQAAELIGYDAFRKEQEQLRDEGRLVGIGLSSYVEPQFGFGILATEAATIRIEPSGTVNVYTSTGNHGQSLETTIAQVIADELGVPFDDVRIIQNDTARTPYGAGTGGSRSAAIASGAAHAAAVVDAAEGAADRGAPARGLRRRRRDGRRRGLGQGRARGRGPAGQHCRRRLPQHRRPAARASAPGLEVSERYKAPSFMFSNATHAVTVEVDRVTGQVQILRYVVSEDCGNMINPMVVEGQIVGGIAQAVGGVFYEHMIYDEDGNPTTTTFLDYLIPTAAEIPDVELGHVVTPSNTPGGYKGLGEGGAICAPAALLNAVRDALAPLGVSVTEQPLSPDRVLRLIDDATPE